MSMTEDLTRRLEASYSAVIHDVMREMGQAVTRDFFALRCDDQVVYSSRLL